MLIKAIIAATEVNVNCPRLFLLYTSNNIDVAGAVARIVLSNSPVLIDFKKGYRFCNS